MAIVCVPKEEANKLRAGIRAGDFSIERLYEMSSKERRAIFEKYVPADLAKFVNTEFEKAMVSNRQTALRDWVEKTFKGKEVAQKKDILDRIDELKEQKLLDPQDQNQFMEDLIAEKLGVKVSVPELKEIVTRTDRLQALAKKTENLQLTPVENAENWAMYFREREDLNKYIQSLTPTNLLAVASSIIGRSFLLASIKSPVVNILGNNVMGTIGALTRRFENLASKHPTIKVYNTDYARDYVRAVWKIWQKSGHDISRMTSVVDDVKIRGENIMHAQGKGPVRKFARGMTDIVFKHAMGDYDVLSASVNFADSAVLNSSQIAKLEGLSGTKAARRAKELFQDATLITPKTKQGQEIRERAIQDAEYFTFTNQARLSDFALRARSFLNKLPGLENLRIGDANIPFAKVPANAISAAVDASGVTVPLHLYNLVRAVKAGSRPGVANALRHLYLAGLGVLGAWLFAEVLNPDDYIGPYESYTPSERKLIEARNGRYRSVKIAGKWISLDYLGPIMAPTVGFLEAKRGDDAFEKSKNYVQAVVSQALGVPGFEAVADAFTFLKEAKTKTVDQVVTEAKDGFVDYLTSRMIPAIISDTAAAFDTLERKADNALDKIKKKIPGLREGLEPKLDLFGNEIKTENPFSTIFFGGRIKTVEDNQVLNELNRLGSTGELPTLTDIRYTSDRAKALQEQIGEDKFIEFFKYYGKEFYFALEQEFKKKSYQELTDEEKKDKINKIKSEILNKSLTVFGYKKTKD